MCFIYGIPCARIYLFYYMLSLVLIVYLLRIIVYNVSFCRYMLLFSYFITCLLCINVCMYVGIYLFDCLLIYISIYLGISNIYINYVFM